jgi:hypothetical protein
LICLPPEYTWNSSPRIKTRPYNDISKYSLRIKS